MKKFLSLFFTLPILAFAQDAAPAAGGSGMMSQFVLIGIALVFFYLILWRPEQKRRKAAEQMRGALKKGDRVTAMGVVGVISAIKEQTVVLRMIEGAKIEMLKGAITDVQPGSSSEEAESSES